MKLWTWSELYTKVENDLALQSEDFVDQTELLGYANEAIDEAEAEILGLYEDYFLTRATITLVQGTEAYALPATIWGQKIRRVIYNNGTELYTVPRLRDWRKFENYADVNQYGQSTDYAYLITSETAGAQSKLVLVPPARENGAYITIWFIRNANELAADADVLDIPEAANFIMQYMKMRCYEKEGHPMTAKAQQDLEHQRQLMLSTLTTMVPDTENEIELDLSAYEEMN